eukprot:TRINITY_DN29491_c0_g1_i1.p1 TRINITY_DN29491_c0_g1~~TRINITY_DN29491_c0_g1_i1.p1  ORF type:complete len:1230 (-),score=316.57 TRINITY_DN29491_c0_g1_i1:446-4135(-)
MGKAGYAKAEPKKDASGDKGKGGEKGKDAAKSAAKNAAKSAAKSDVKSEAKHEAKSEVKTAAAKSAPKEPEPPVDPQVKLKEEAQQKYADEERDEVVRVELRKINQEAKASGAQLKGSRDKTLARVTRFQNRLKLFKGESEMDGVMKDIDGVDASKYVVELAECILEAAGNTVKLKELNSVIKVCSKLNATYEEFSSLLSKGVVKAFQATPASELNRRRFLFRMCAELVLVECLSDAKPLLEIAKELCDISVSEEQVVTNFTIISSLAQKHGPSCLNSVPAKQQSYTEALGKEWVTRQCVLDGPTQGQLQQLAVNAYQGAGAGLLRGAHSRLLEQEKINAALRVDKGQVDAENETNHAQFKEQFQKIQTTLTALSECFNQPMPTTEEEEDPNVLRLADKETKEEVVEEEEVLIFEDSEQQKFYEDLVDLKDVVPAVLLGGKAAEGAAAEGEKEAKPEKPPDTSDKPKEVGVASDFDLYLMRVTKAESAKQVDDIVIEFFHEFNTKSNRRALATKLYGVHKLKELHLIAPHARLVALVAPFLKDIPNFMMSWLQHDLEQVMGDKDANSLEQKIKIVKYLCELCKFKVCPPGVILDTFKVLCDDFSQQNAELCAHILSCCGRYLLYKPETATRTENLLERMLRLSKAKSLPLRLEIMLEDAYYQVKPPESKRKKPKEKDPMEIFTEYLIFDRLYKEEDEEKILKLTRKLPWDGPAVGWLKKSLLDLNHHANYENLSCVASLLSGLAKYRDGFVIDVIDSLFENIQVTLERNDFREMPLRVRQTKLLGELYNYRLIDSGLVFDSLYQFIGFGGPTAHMASHITTAHKILERALAIRKGGLTSISEEAGEEEEGIQLPLVFADPQHPLEAPWDFFRIKLVCVLLETCGHYFDRGASKQKLDRFLTFFARYVHSKGELPQRFMYMVYDTIERIRPKQTFPTKDAADEAVLKLLESERESMDIGADEKAASPEEDSTDEDEDEDEDESSSDDDSSDDEEAEEESDTDDDEDVAAYDRHDVETEKKHAAAEDDFDKEVQEMLMEALEREKNAPKRGMSELPPPPAIKTSSDQPRPMGMFSLMQKKPGGKTQLKQIEIPEDSKLVQAKQIEKEEATQEKEDLKRFVMQYDAIGAGGASGMVIPVTVRTRAGKGGGLEMKGKGSRKGSRGNTDYLGEDLMPEESKPEVPIMHGPLGGGIVVRYSSKGSKGAGSKGAKGSKGSKGDRKGTPPEAPRDSF